MILPRFSKSPSVTLLTDWITSESRGCKASFDNMFSFNASRKVMKFSVAAKIRLPDAPPPPDAVLLAASAPCEACSTVAGSPMRNRSVARGHSNWIRVRHDRQWALQQTYSPCAFESLQIYKFSRHGLISHTRFVLLQKPRACLGVLRLGDYVLDVCFLKAIESDDNAIYFGE